jgi:hypothetical protein
VSARSEDARKHRSDDKIQGPDMANHYLTVYPDGTMIKTEDTGREEDYNALENSILGPITDHSYIMWEPFIVTAMVEDNGIIDGSTMQQSHFLKGLAGPALLVRDSKTEHWRGFTEGEMRLVKQLIEDAGWMSEEEAEKTRPLFDDAVEPF